MTTFALEKPEEVRDGKLIFYKLVVNGKCLYDEFCRDAEGNKQDLMHLNKIRTYMNIMAGNDMMFPKKKLNSIKDKNVVIGYEFKSDNLRVYMIKQEPNVYVVAGGYKATQEKDIAIFRRLAKEFRTYQETGCFNVKNEL